MIETLGSQIIGIGSKGENVEYLQAILGVEQDGIFGGETETALKELQTKLGIEADGIYGPQTKNALSALFE